jgi:hypothetical protein
MVFARFLNRLPLICRVILFGIAAASFGWCAHLITQRLVQFNGPKVGILLGVPGLLGAFTAFAAFRFDDQSVQRVARELVFVGATLLSAELLVATWAPDLGSAELARAAVARRLDVSFDTRTKSQVVTALQSQGVDALPGILRAWPVLSGVRQQLPENFFPLSHASHAHIIECNEGGEYISYDSDELGFNNPPGLLTSKQIDVAVLGSAFALGQCVAPTKSFVGLLRGKFPNTANFAMAGSGATSSLATFREYIEPLQPRLVIWVINAFMGDGPEEAADPMLQQYLQPGFSQNLRSRQEFVDRIWRESAVTVQFEVDRKKKVKSDRANSNRLDGIPYLYNLRHKLGIDQLPIVVPRTPDAGSTLAAIDRINQTVQQWKGKLIVVIEPLYAEVALGEVKGPVRHDRLAAAVAAMDVAVVDGVDLFSTVADPRDYYGLRIGNHLNERGHALMADFVAERINDQRGDKGRE